MKAYAIVLKDHEVSEKGYETLVKSSWDLENEFTLERFDAIIPSEAEDLMEQEGLKWNYPWQGQVIDFSTGLMKTAYKGSDYRKRIACAMSHWFLWKKAKETNEDVLILEHDAKFIRRIDFDIRDTPFLVLGINNPLGSTRKSREYVQCIQNDARSYQPVPTLDADVKIPHGLAGNSAYIITPMAANEIIEKAKNVGLWPNDALLCKQLFSFLGVTKKFYTEVQGLPSTTST